MDAVVGEGRQVLLVDRVPEPKLGGDSPVEVSEDVKPVASFRRRRKPEQLRRLQMFEKCPVRRCRGVVELVDDHDVEVPWVDRLDA